MSTRNRLLRVFVPVVIVVMMTATIIAIALYAYQSNRRDTLTLSDDLLDAVNKQIATEVESYLSSAASMARFTAGVAPTGNFLDERERLIEPLAMNALQQHPQIAILTFADADGNFLMVKRMPNGSADTKIINQSDAGRTVQWIHRDGHGDVTNVEDVANDTYDARERPWFRGAADTKALFWSDVYVFFTDKKPGVTASLPLLSDDGKVIAVYGVDIELERLSAFLASLDIGSSGRAMIIDGDGALVAYPDATRMLRQAGDKLETVNIEALNDPVLLRAYNRFRIEGHGRRTIEVEEERHVSMTSSLESTVGKEWSVLIVAPEKDFVGFLAQNNKTTLLLSLGVLGLAALLAGLLVAQGIRADKNERLVHERQRRLEEQSEAFSEIADEAMLFDLDDPKGLSALAKTVAQALGVRRVSFWRLLDDGDTLLCDEAYDRASATHTQGAEFRRRHLPALLECLSNGQELQIDNAESDPRIRDLSRIYLAPLGCTSLLSVPIEREDACVGAVWIEDGVSDSEEAVISTSEAKVFARTIASMIALRYSVEHQQVRMPSDDLSSEQKFNSPLAEVRSERRVNAVAGNRTEAFDARVRAQTDTLEAEVFKDASVLIVKLTEAVSLGRGVGETNTALVNQIVQELQQLGNALGVEYVKIMNDQIVCASGFEGTAQTSARAVAELALEVQARCARLFSDIDRRAEFRIGVDTGPVMGSVLGEEHKIYNLWGDAVQMAALMAESGEAGCVQTTETFYELLRTGYLFRGRGTYYTAQSGELPTYLLTGRI